MTSESKWKEMLDEFRAFGGTAENVRLGYGALGRGLFPIDPAKSVDICIPESLLVPLDDVIFDNDVFRVRDDSLVSERGRAFVERYEHDFAWGTEARAEIERVLTTMHTLPEKLRNILEKGHLSRFLQPLTAELVQKAFLATRAISSGGRTVVMPIIELANHGGSATYGGERDVSLRDKFEGEVLVQYSFPADPYDIFLNWFFVSQEPCAFSMPMTYSKGGTEFRIGREYEKEQRPWVPKISVIGNTISLDYLLLGHRSFPRVPRGAFHKAMANAGLEPEDEVFEQIQHANRQTFLDLIGELEGIDSPAVPLLRTMARYQLNALSSHFGIRQV